jgi:cell division transport system permease protein
LDSNPFGPTMVVRTREPGDYIKIMGALEIPEYEDVIDSKTFADSQKTIERVSTVTSQVERFSLLLSILFGVIAFLIIFNTIRVSIFTQRTEISIKKLVGATNWFVSGPYVIEALVFSLLAVALTYILMVVALGFLQPYIEVVFGQGNLLTDYLNDNIILLLAVELATVFVLTVASSMLAMRRYLKI